MVSVMGELIVHLTFGARQQLTFMIQRKTSLVRRPGPQGLLARIHYTDMGQRSPHMVQIMSDGECEDLATVRTWEVSGAIKDSGRLQFCRDEDQSC